MVHTRITVASHRARIQSVFARKAIRSGACSAALDHGPPGAAESAYASECTSLALAQRSAISSRAGTLEAAQWPTAAAALARLLDEGGEGVLSQARSSIGSSTWLAGFAPESGVLLLPVLRVCVSAPEMRDAEDCDNDDAAAAPVSQPRLQHLLHRAVSFHSAYGVPQLLIDGVDERSGAPLSSRDVLRHFDSSAILSPVETGWPFSSPLGAGRWLALHPCNTAAVMALLLEGCVRDGGDDGGGSIERYMRAWWHLADAALARQSRE